jgi:hypothetical protein
MGAMFRLAAGAAYLWLLVLGAGCAGAPVAVDFDPQTEFLFYRTFAWLGHTGVPRGEPESLPGTRIHRIVADALATHGITETAPDQADLWVRYRTNVHSEVVRTPIPIDPPPPRGERFERRPFETYIYVDKTRYFVGTLTIELIDRKAQRVVWEGTTSEAAVDRAAARRPTPEAAARIMAAFPPMHR